MIFQDRQHAGVLLASKLLQFRDSNPLVLALPRGGAPVASEIASRLEVPWSVLIVRKIGLPSQPELAVGAVCEDDEPQMNQEILSMTGLGQEDLRRVIEFEKERVQSYVQTFRGGHPLDKIQGRLVIVVDDGLATGATVVAAIKYLRKKGAAHIVVAVPIAAASSARRVRQIADEVITVEEREDLFAIGPWYRDFAQVPDEEVMELMHPAPSKMHLHRKELEIDADDVKLKGILTSVPHMKGLIVFAHGSGSSRLSPRNQMVAHELNFAGFGTLLFDLLSSEEADLRENVFHIPLLSRRLMTAVHFLRQKADFRNLPIGFFGASTGAAAALSAASQLASENDSPFAVVSRGGRPDLARDDLKKVVSPTLLIVGERDEPVIRLNSQARKFLKNSDLVIVPEATHLFEEEGALEKVAEEARAWFIHYCPENIFVKPLTDTKSMG